MTGEKPRSPERPHWVFAYGSLMWDPGFTPDATSPALLHGWHRSFCIRSHHYRGTPQSPGLILGLAPGGACRGLAHRIPQASYDAVRDYLYRREIENDGVYFEVVRPIRLPGNRSEASLVYVADRHHPQYAGELPLQQAARLVRQGRGVRGANLEYVANTIAHLDALGLAESRLHQLLALAQIAECDPQEVSE
jgi:cation transport protein ChaC